MEDRNKPTSEPRNNLDVIRSLLALGVMCFHALPAIGVQYPQLPWVPAFIAISGYLVTGSVLRSNGYWDFLWKRFLRVAPAFALSFLLVYALGLDAFAAFEQWATMGIREDGPNGPLWSLSVEEVLYLLLATAYAVGIYATTRRALISLATIFLLVVAIGITKFSPPARFIVVSLCFVSGSVFFILRDKVHWSPLLGIACLLGATFLRNSPISQTGSLYGTMVGPLIAYAFISLAFHTPPIFAKYKHVIGDPSFGMYVYHMPILIWLQKTIGITGLLLPLLTIALATTLALISWHLIEKQALKIKKSK